MAYFDSSFLQKPASLFAGFGDKLDLFNDPETARMRRFGVRVALATLAGHIASNTGQPFEAVFADLKAATKASAYLLDCADGWRAIALAHGVSADSIAALQ